MAKHTAGPWAVIPPDAHSQTWYISRDRLDAPVGVVPEHIDDGRPYYIAVFGCLMERGAAEANAHLVAAAPLLLAAREKEAEVDKHRDSCRWCNDSYYPCCQWCDTALDLAEQARQLRQAALTAVKGEK